MLGLSRENKILIILTVVNIGNYLDRQLIFSLFPLIKNEFPTSDFQLGLLGTLFTLTYAITILPAGILADRWYKQKLITLGMLFWSFFTFASGFSQRLYHLISARGLIGIGGATFEPAAVSMVTENFHDSYRGRTLGIIKSGMWIGGMLGLTIGGILGTHIGWRYTLFIAGIPGFVLAFFTWNMTRGEAPKFKVEQQKRRVFDWSVLVVLIILGGVFANFSAGAFIAWVTTFIVRYGYFELSTAAPLAGGVAMVFGLAGVLTGSSLADRLYQKNKRGRLLTVTLGMLIATPFTVIAIFAPNPVILIGAIGFGTFFMAWYHGPIMAVLMDSVAPAARGAMAGVYFFFIHLLGDMPAPALIGRISDLFNLRIALLMTGVGNILCVLFFVIAIFKIKRD